MGEVADCTVTDLKLVTDGLTWGRQTYLRRLTLQKGACLPWFDWLFDWLEDEQK